MGQGHFKSDLPVKVATKMLFGAMDQMATSWVLGQARLPARGHRARGGRDLFLQGVAARR